MRAAGLLRRSMFVGNKICANKNKLCGKFFENCTLYFESVSTHKYTQDVTQWCIGCWQAAAIDTKIDSGYSFSWHFNLYFYFSLSCMKHDHWSEPISLSPNNSNSGSLCPLVRIISFIWHCFRQFNRDIDAADVWFRYVYVYIHFEFKRGRAQCTHTVHTLPIRVRVCQTYDAMKMKSGKFDWKRN